MNLDTAWAGLTVQGKINEGKETDSYSEERDGELLYEQRRWCSDVMARLAFPLGHSWKWSECLDVLAEQEDGYKWDLALIQMTPRGIGSLGLRGT